MSLWNTLVWRHLPHGLARKSAPAWILAGTVTFAGVSAAVLERPHASTPPTAVLPMTLLPIGGPCQISTLSTDPSGCMRHFWMGHQHRHADQDWESHQGEVFPATLPVPPKYVLNDSAFTLPTR